LAPGYPLATARYPISAATRVRCVQRLPRLVLTGQFWARASTGRDNNVMTIPSRQPHVDSGAEAALPLDDGEIYVRQDGPRDAPALLLIHGNSSSARWWDELVPLLTGSHRVIRIDLLGYGRSAKPEDRSYALPDQARRVGVAMDRLGVGRVVAVGHSSGGAAATALAEHRPGLVTALVLINTGPHLGAYTAPPTAIDPAQWQNVTDEQLRQFASAAFSRPGYQAPLELLKEAHAMTFHSLTATTQASRDYVREQALPDRLAPLGKPLLVIFGEEDRRWRSSSAADYLAVPGARVEMLPGVGHTPILEDPVRTASCLLAFTTAQVAQED
jgi:pimeloyl-ACP methyl ester carboxylesterase